jgi:sugar lactone lactonase YvrE
VSGSFASAILSIAGASLLLAAAVPALAQGAYTVPGATAVGTASSTQTATVTITTSTGNSLATINVLTLGATGLDYALASGGTCSAGTMTTYTSGQTCTVNFTFTPSHPWARFGGITLIDTSGNLIGYTYLNGTGAGPQISYPLSSATVPSALGSGFTLPSGVAVDGLGNVYVADTHNTQIVKIAAAGGAVSTLGCCFSHPSGVAVDGIGNIYVADTQNSAVKEIVAGAGTIVSLGSGFSAPTGVAVDGSGNVYVADTGNPKIVEIAAGNGTQTTLGSGFSGPSGVAVDASGNVYVADTGNSKVKEIAAVGGAVTTLGSNFNAPAGVAVDASGDVYVGDTSNKVVKEMVAVNGAVPPTPANPTILTLGSGFKTPTGVAVDASGNLYVADTGIPAVEELNAQGPPSLTFVSTAVGASSSQTLVVANNGNTLSGNPALLFTVPGTGTNPNIALNAANFSVNVGSSTCPQLTTTSSNPGSLAPGASCTDVVSFAPTAAGSIAGSLVLTDNAANSPQTIPLSGTATAGQLTVSVAPQTGVVDSVVNATSVNLIATIAYGGVAPSFTPNAPSFTVNGGSAIPATCTGTSSPLTCTATYNPSGLMAGSYPIVFNVPGDSNGNYSTPNPGTGALYINPAAATLAISSWPSSAAVDASATFTATLSTSGGFTVPTASTDKVTFTLNGTTVLSCSPSPLSPSTQMATCSTTQLVGGSDTVTATLVPGDPNYYAGNAPPAASGSATLAASATTVTAPATAGAGVPVTLTATIAPATGLAQTVLPQTGTITFSDSAGSGTFCTTTVSGGVLNPATCSHSFTTVGSHVITATFTSGDPNFLSSIPASQSSATVSVNASGAALTVGASAGNPPSPYVNQSDTFTAAFANFPTNLTAPPGTVTYSDGVTTISGCSALTVTVSGGSAIIPPCADMFVLAGQHSISASFVPSAYGTSLQIPSLTSTNVVTVTVAKNTPLSITVSSNLATTAVVNQAVTFSSTITPASSSASGAVPTGSLTFTKGSGGPTVCSAVVTANGNGTSSASCSGSFASSVSGTPIYAVYSGDANFFQGTAPTLAQTVLAAPSATSVMSSSSSANVSQNVTLTATVSPALTGSSYPGTTVPQTGTVTFSDSAASGTFCSSTLSGGVLTPATCSHAFTSLGTHVITAAFTSSDTNFNNSTVANSVTVTVTNTGTTLALSASSSNPASPVVNQSDTFLASIAAPPSGLTGTITYSDSLTGVIPNCLNLAVTSATNIPPCPETFATFGARTISAVFTQTASQGSLVLTSPGFGPISVSQNTTTVAFTSPTTTGATATSSVDQAVTFTAAVTPAALTPAAVGTTSPSGTVAFSYLPNGTPTTLCVASVLTTAGVASASCSAAFPQASGSSAYTVKATYSGDTNFTTPATAPTIQQTVNAATLTLAAPAPSPSPQLNTPTLYTATISQPPGPTIPSGTITFTDTATGTKCGPIAVSIVPGPTIGQASCSLTLTTAGSHTITVSYIDSNATNPNFTALSTTVGVTVGKSTPTFSTFTSSLNPSVATQQITYIATVTGTASGTAPTGTFSFSGFPAGTVLPTGNCTSVAGTGATNTLTASCAVTFPATVSGNQSIIATYSGDSNYSAATSPTITQTVENLTLSGSSIPATLTISQGNTNLTDAYGSQPISLTVADQGGLAQTLTFVCTTPSGVTCTATGTAGTISPGQAIPAGTYTIQLAAAASTTPSTAASPYTVPIGASDSVTSGLSQTVNTSLIIVSQPSTSVISSQGTATPGFIASSGLSGLACSQTVATLQTNGSYTTTTGATLGSIGIACSSITVGQAPSNVTVPAGFAYYSFTITAGGSAAVRLQTTGNKGIVLAGLGAPFLLILGLLPASRKLRKTLLRSLAIVVVGLLAMYATGCGSSGGFKPQVGSAAVDGSYLINIQNTQKATVAEVPIIVED